MIQAPYETTLSRDNIRESEKNDQITEHLAALVTESLPVLKKRKLLTWKFFDLLPHESCEASDDDPYCMVHEAICKKLHEKPLLPIGSGRFAKAGKCIIATDGVRRLFEPGDLNEGEKKWLRDEDLNYELREFLEYKLGIERIDLQQVAEKVNNWKGLLRGKVRKNPKWLLKLYKFLYEDERAEMLSRNCPLSHYRAVVLESLKTLICRWRIENQITRL